MSSLLTKKLHCYEVKQPNQLYYTTQVVNLPLKRQKLDYENEHHHQKVSRTKTFIIRNRLPLHSFTTNKNQKFKPATLICE